MDEEKNINVENDDITESITEQITDTEGTSVQAETANVQATVQNAETTASAGVSGVPQQPPVPDQYARYAMPNGYWNGNQPYGFIGYPPAGFQNPMTPPNQPKKPSKLKKIFGAAGLAVVFGLVAAAVFIASVGLYQRYFVEPKDTKPTTAQLQINDKTTETKLNLDPVSDTNKQIAPTVISNDVSVASTDVSKVVENGMPSIVSIDCTFANTSIWGTYKSSGAGSGIILQKNDTELLIATNSHVISDALTIKVTFINSKSYDATLKGKDQVADLAVIAIPLADIDSDTLDAIKVAKLGSSDDIKVGQMAIAIGNSLGYGQSVTVGYVSAKDREVNVDGKKMILLQTDAAINPGNSGGALFNINGEVIGINSVKYADSTVEGMGFAIPISRAFDILSDLSTREILTDEEKGYLGVYIETVTEDIAKAYNWPVGIYITSFPEGSAAEKAGMQVGDIITGVNGAELKDANQLSEKIQSYRYGTEITVTFQRMTDGVYEEKEITVTLSQKPETFDSKASEPGKIPEDKAEVPEDKNEIPEGSTELPENNGSDNNRNPYYYYDPFDSDPFGFGFDPFEFFEW